MPWGVRSTPVRHDDKGGSGVATDVNRDVIRVWVEGNTELRTVAQVAIDPTWSALRLKR